MGGGGGGGSLVDIRDFVTVASAYTFMHLYCALFFENSLIARTKPYIVIKPCIVLKNTIAETFSSAKFFFCCVINILLNIFFRQRTALNY